MYYHHLHQPRYSNIGCGIFRKRVRAYVQCAISFGAFFSMYILGDDDTYLRIWMTWFYLPLEHLCCQNMIKLPNESYTNCDQNPPMALHKKLLYVFCFKSNFSWCILMSNPIPGPLDWKKHCRQPGTPRDSRPCHRPGQKCCILNFKDPPPKKNQKNL